MYQIDFNHPIHVFFCGIGGISMSGLAEILASRAFTVSGSDRQASAITEHLVSAGIKVCIPQAAENITEDIDLVVFTAAIHPDNPEYVRTEELGIPHLTRAEVLGEIMRNYAMPVAIAGTHGKTTTTSMISEILLQEDADPTISVGGIMPAIGGNVRVGHSDYFVAEACEYTNSYLSLFPKVSVILNVDADHLDFFKDIEDIRRSFHQFAALLPEDGTLVINSDIPEIEKVTDGLSCRIVTYGSDPARSDYYAENVTYDANAHASYTACCRIDGHTAPTEITLSVPGEHNVYNSLAALAVADTLGIDRGVAATALLAYTGTDRRFQFKGEMDGVKIYDDYAHHPTEMRATIETALHTPHERLFVIFQPHTYTRTKALFDDFAQVLTLPDVTILEDIYAARETDTLGVSSELLAETVRGLGHEETYYLGTPEKIVNFIRTNCRKGDVVITMGAGNVTEIGPSLLA